MTLNRFLVDMTRTNPDHADFESLFGSIQIACKTIANLLSRAGVEDLIGSSNANNPEIWGTLTHPLTHLLGYVYTTHILRQPQCLPVS